MNNFKRALTEQMMQGKRKWPLRDILYLKNNDYPDLSGFPKLGYISEAASSENPNITVYVETGPEKSLTYMDINSAIQDGWEVD
jgi:hypothetical protein